MCRERRLENQPCLADIAQAPFGIFLETSRDQIAEMFRRCRRESIPVRLVASHRGQKLGRRIAGEWSTTGEHLVEDAAERPDVGPFVDRSAYCLLGRHV